MEVVEPMRNVSDVLKESTFRDGGRSLLIGGNHVAEIAFLCILHHDEQPFVLAPRVHVSAAAREVRDGMGRCIGGADHEQLMGRQKRSE